MYREIRFRSTSKQTLDSFGFLFESLIHHLQSLETGKFIKLFISERQVLYIQFKKYYGVPSLLASETTAVGRIASHCPHGVHSLSGERDIYKEDDK